MSVLYLFQMLIKHVPYKTQSRATAQFNYVCTHKMSVACLILFTTWCIYLISGIELDEDGTLDGNSDSTIRGRLLYLMEKVTYLKKKQDEKMVDEEDKTSCK